MREMRAQERPPEAVPSTRVAPANSEGRMRKPIVRSTEVHAVVGSRRGAWAVSRNLDTAQVRHLREHGWEEALRLLEALPPMMQRFDTRQKQQQKNGNTKDSTQIRTTVDGRLLDGLGW